jgi:hypothetical protein
VKKTLRCLFAGVVLAASSVVFADAIFEREAQSQTAAARIGTPFVWPDDARAAEPETALRILAEAAEATGSNVLRTSVSTVAHGRKSITHYILMSRDHSRLFDGFALAEGRWLTPAESLTGSATISSARPAGPASVGVPAVFGDRYNLTFAPLRLAFGVLPNAGRYVVESLDGDATGRFLGIVHQRLVAAGVAGLALDDLTAADPPSAAGSGGRLRPLAYLFACLATLVVVALCRQEGKRIGVMRLLGHSYARIWYRVVGGFQLAAGAGALAACTVVALAVPGADSPLLRALAVALAETTAAGLAATVVAGLLVIKRAHTADLIKGSVQ